MEEAVAYTRISELDQSNNSLDNQAQRIKEYCTTNNITLKKIFTDNGKSAFTFDRPEWLNLERYLKANKQIMYLLVQHIDRFSRANLMDALVKLNEIEVKLKVKVLAVSDPLNLDTKDFSVQLIRSINLLFSNNERNRIQERVKDGIYRSLANGRFCNMAPYGYVNSKVDGKPLITIDPVRSMIVKKIFMLYQQGLELYEIWEQVKKDGYKQKSWSAIKRILANPLYAGLIDLPAYKGQPTQQVNAIHAPLISKQAYYSIQSKLNGKKVSTQKNDEVFLRGILHCECGRKMTAGNSKSHTGKYYWYYKCPVHQVNYASSKLHTQFKSLLNHLSFKEADISILETTVKQSLELHQSKKGGNIMRFKLELEKVRKKIGITQERYLTDTSIEPAIYAKVMNELKADEARLEGDIGKSKTDTDTMLHMLSGLLPRLKNIGNIFSEWPLHQQQLFINTVFCSSLFYRDGIYRTPKLYPLFVDKALILKENGLLEIEQSANFKDELSSCTRDGSGIELLSNFMNVFVA